MTFESVDFSSGVLFNDLAQISKRYVPPASIDVSICCKDGMHIAAGACFGPSLETLRERVFFIGLDKHVSLRITKNLVRVDTAQSEIRVSVYAGEEVFSSAGVFEGVFEKVMKLVVVGIERVDIVVEVVFEAVPLICFWTEVVVSLLDVL